MSSTTVSRRRAGLSVSRVSRWATPWMFLLPAGIVFLVFWLYPIANSFYLSLTSWDALTPPVFIGFDNYADLISDTRFQVALANTLKAGIVYVAVLMAFALLFSIVLGWFDVRGRTIFRSALFLPVSTALVVAGVVFYFVYGRDYGLLNGALGVLGIPAQDWLGNPDLALWSIVGIRLWRNIGYYAIFLIAGLQNIPSHVYEAARVDGANNRQIVFRVTLPLLRPMIFYVLVVSTIWALQLFDEPWVLTKGGPGLSTTTLVTYLYQNTFQYFQLGYGAAVSYVLTLIILVFAIVQARLTKSTLDR